jgi:hypothetical protein
MGLALKKTSCHGSQAMPVFQNNFCCYLPDEAENTFRQGSFSLLNKLFFPLK